MKIKFIIPVTLLIVSVFLLLAESCTIYLPQTASIPLMNERNEVQISGGFTSLAGVNGSVAFAPGDHVALQAYGSMHTSEIRYYQGSVGYYTKSKSNINFEIYAGLAAGNGNDLGYGDEVYVNGDYQLYFAQANVGQTNLGKAHIDYGFGLKTGMFDAKVIDYTHTYPLHYTNNFWLLEPQSFVRMGGEKFKVGFQANGTWIFNMNNQTSMLLFYPLNLGLSINFRIAPSMKSK